MMEKQIATITREAIFHLPKSNYSYGYDRDTLHIRLRTKKGEVEKVTLRIGDPYIWSEGGPSGGNLTEIGSHWSGGENVPMKKETETDLFDYWFVAYKPKQKRSRYAFIVENQQEKLLFGEKRIEVLDGINDEIKLIAIGNFFCFPYLTGADVGVTPKWVKDTVWYQFFPDRFHNGDPSINPEGVEPWGSKPTMSNFNGGDLQGIIDKLDYLQDLGINGLYFCPIFKATTNHRYDTVDYMQICPYLGTDDTFHTLVKEAHKRGMKIMIDAVYNHLGYYSPQWQDVVKNGEKSKFKDWFHIHKFPLREGNVLNYETFGDVAEMPKVNTENPEVFEFLLEVGRYWVREFDIDAWRLDVANEVDHVFWREFRKQLRAIKEDVFILGEIWHDSLPWLMGDQFDAVMNYPLTDAITEFFCKDELSASEFMYAVNKIKVAYPLQMNEVTFNLLDSHDTSRIISVAGGNKEKAKLAYLFMFTQAGSPCIYYGGEVGMEGIKEMGSEDHRQCMIWDEEKQDRDFFAFIQRLIAVRKEIPALKSTENEWIVADDATNSIILKKEDVTIIINNTAEAKEIALPSYLQQTKAINVFTKQELLLNNTITLPAYGFSILK